MLYVKDHKTRYMFDPFDHLGPKRKKLLKESWAKVFRDSVLPYLPVELLAKYYDPTQGRPTAPIGVKSHFDLYVKKGQKKGQTAT